MIPHIIIQYKHLMISVQNVILYIRIINVPENYSGKHQNVVLNNTKYRFLERL